MSGAIVLSVYDGKALQSVGDDNLWYIQSAYDEVTFCCKFLQRFRINSTMSLHGPCKQIHTNLLSSLFSFTAIDRTPITSKSLKTSKLSDLSHHNLLLLVTAADSQSRLNIQADRYYRYLHMHVCSYHNTMLGIVYTIRDKSTQIMDDEVQV